jgi:hypothetical protein
MLENYMMKDDFSLSNNQSNSIESIIWDSSTQTKFSNKTYAFGFVPYGDNGISIYDAMYAYLANKTPAPTFTATYTVSIEQVID